MQPAASLEMTTRKGIPQVYLKLNSYFKEEHLNSCFQIHHLQQKLEYYLQNLRIGTIKTLL